MKANSDLPEATAEFETADRNVNLFIGYLPCVKPTMPEVKRRQKSLITSLFSELDVRSRLALKHW